MFGRETGAVLFYEDRYYMFSNFSSFEVFYGLDIWKTAEHAYQAAKFTDKDILTKIRHAHSAHDAKKIARANQEHYRPDWNGEEKLRVMEEIVSAKLSQHDFVRERLLETGSRLIVENSHKDSFWGWGRDMKGANHLGKIWMKLREEERKKEQQRA